jgi:hypothetical protein
MVPEHPRRGDVLGRDLCRASHRGRQATAQKMTPANVAV